MNRGDVKDELFDLKMMTPTIIQVRSQDQGLSCGPWLAIGPTAANQGAVPLMVSQGSILSLCPEYSPSMVSGPFQANQGTLLWRVEPRFRLFIRCGSIKKMTTRSLVNMWPPTCFTNLQVA